MYVCTYVREGHPMHVSVYLQRLTSLSCLYTCIPLHVQCIHASIVLCPYVCMYMCVLFVLLQSIIFCYCSNAALSIALASMSMMCPCVAKSSTTNRLGASAPSPPPSPPSATEENPTKWAQTGRVCSDGVQYMYVHITYVCVLYVYIYYTLYVLRTYACM